MKTKKVIAMRIESVLKDLDSLPLILIIIKYPRQPTITNEVTRSIIKTPVDGMNQREKWRST
jgi:hypothetical protein